MGFRDDLKAARARYAGQLAAQMPPPDYSWNEYEEWLLDQIRKIDQILAEDDQRTAAEAQAEAEAQTEVISGGFTTN